MDAINTIGRRKAAVCRVFLTEGKGSIEVNGKDFKVYFCSEHLSNKVMEPLEILELTSNFDIKINASGGGPKGQAEAARLGIARALVEHNPEWKSALKKKELMTRDARVVERKKPGLKKARKATQYRKR